MVVDYGTTTDYGSTTEPVDLSGSVSGSQPFTIPLTDLTSGTTYNYRVRATNADGEVSFTLPDADGSYGVRLIRTDAEGQSSTSVTVPVVLDRAAPDVANLDITVLPTNSNVATRTVSFARPVDATSVSAQVIDADDAPVGPAVPVTGDSASVTLGQGDGSYRVRLTLTDAAGNAADATSGSVTLDTTAPTPGPAPTVTGDGNSRVRTVAFTRDATAATASVEILDGDGEVLDTVSVPTGGSTTVTLPDEDGDYGIRVRQSDAAGNAASTPVTDVSLDRVAPDVSGLALELTPALSNDRDRTVTIVRPTDAATVTAQVIDAEDAPVVDPVTIVGTSGTVTLGTTDGSYRVLVTVADAAGNLAEQVSAPVTLDLAGPVPGPAPVVSGGPDSLTVTFVRAADAAMVTVEVRDANGSLVRSIKVPTGDSATFRLPETAGLYTVRIVQTDALGNSRTTSETTVERAPTPPGTRPPGTPPGTTPPGATPPPSADPVACAKPAIVLTQVRRQGSRVRISGFTTHGGGTTVQIVDLDGTRLGTATVGTSGTFSARVTAPRTADQRARVGYRALVGRHRSPAVKLGQVNTLRTVARSGDTVTLRGRISVRDDSRFRTVVAYGGSGGCPTINKRLETVGTPTINRRTGTYTLRVLVPASDRLVIKTRATVGGGNYHATHTVSDGL